MMSMTEPPPPDKVPCVPAVSSDALHPRSGAMNGGAASGAPTFFTRDLFNLFRSHCGGCHVDNGLGGLKVTLLDFPDKITNKALDRIRSDDASFFMPPTGIPFSTRKPDDPIVEFASLLEDWLAAGSPAGVFYPSGAASSASHSYVVSDEVAQQMTNIGSCVPDAEMVGRETERSTKLDEMFAKAKALPKRLEETDLTTFDSAELAREGVIAFAPAYTLWADNAKKIRLVRVPRGQAMAFDPETQQFTIPPNTRFYKTFLKQVIDEKGNESYRKIETRLILSRPDEQLPDGSFESRALFGTYAWNESETEAVLVEDPLRNGQPFRDRLLTYVTNEKIAEQVLRTGPEDLDAALREAGVTRTYAIPGGERCRHCHMGAVNGSFVLGFTPLQINRRPMGEGGVIEPAERDELNQLQRFLDYGLIEGMGSAKDVVLLEDSQGDRKPRNEQELIAQGYMIGNCSHCHNPRGFPTQIAPELRGVLDFYPSKEGGIFQFPLERFSPRIFRGPERDVPIPYITPSLYDRSVDGPSDKVATYDRRRDSSGKPLLDAEGNFLPTETELIRAPWRSLIYRNTDAPFSYADDRAIFPHMPFDTAGYDCRVRRIMGEWMTSIPARWKYEGKDLPKEDGSTGMVSPTEFEIQGDHEPQPYADVAADDPEYSRYVRLAKARMRQFQQSRRYSDCPDPSLDVVDPAVMLGTQLVPKRYYQTVLESHQLEVGHVSLPVPERPHWAVTDLTEPEGAWNPRRPDWRGALMDGPLPDDPVAKLAIDLLRNANIRVTGNDGLRSLALDDMPFGVWLAKDDCDFSSIPKLSELATQPDWVLALDAANRPPPESRVYSISPGAQVFTAICANCHGPLADSSGRLAATIADMTGGETRVANLRDGIFGPIDAPGSNRAGIFEVAGSDISSDDWAARYLLWMGLGGTQRTIPPAALSVVASTTIMGKRRTGVTSFSTQTANMLTVAAFLCGEVLGKGNKAFDVVHGQLDHNVIGGLRSALIASTGDAEMWRRLCTFENPVPVRVVIADVGAGIVSFQLRTVANVDPSIGEDYPIFDRASYPADSLVGDQLGRVTTGIQPDNTDPWCVTLPLKPTDIAELERLWVESLHKELPVPYCPLDKLRRSSVSEVNRWTTRGAMNAGLSVFMYLDALARGEKRRPIPYDHCEDLAAQRN
jgi:mono/diheme cytochrome c family protein